MSSDTLCVRHFGRDVGTIKRTSSGALHFEYAGSWLNIDGRFALATSLPLEPGPVETAYFRNLLPEAGARQRIAKVAGFSSENDFEFLRVFGAYCAGSLEITDPDETSTPTEGPGILPLLEQNEQVQAAFPDYTDQRFIADLVKVVAAGELSDEESERVASIVRLIGSVGPYLIDNAAGADLTPRELAAGLADLLIKGLR